MLYVISTASFSQAIGFLKNFVQRQDLYMCNCTKIAVIGDGMERRLVYKRFRRMEQPMAWKRTVQFPTAMAEA